MLTVVTVNVKVEVVETVAVGAVTVNVVVTDEGTVWTVDRVDVVVTVEYAVIVLGASVTVVVAGIYVSAISLPFIIDSLVVVDGTTVLNEEQRELMVESLSASTALRSEQV